METEQEVEAIPLFRPPFAFLSQPVSVGQYFDQHGGIGLFRR
jgi:hypothetical protein